MKLWVVFACLLYACEAYPTNTEATKANLCEMDIKQGVFENKLVPGGQYLHDTTVYQTAEDCMRSCCYQAINAAASNQIPCNMAYYYQEPDPYNSDTLRNVCVWWNCKPDECQPNQNVDPDSTARVGFLLPLEQQQQQLPQKQQELLQHQHQELYPEQNPSIPEINQHGAVQPSYQYPADNSQGHQVVPQYETGYGYQSNQVGGIPQAPAVVGQYDTQEAVPTNQYHQPIPTSQYQNQDVPQSIGMPSEQTGNVEAQNANGEGRWIYDPNSGQYVFTNPVQATGHPAPVATETDLISENATSFNESYLGLEANKTNLDNTTDSYGTSTTTEVYTSTEDQGWFWGKWWDTDDDDDDEDDDDDLEDDDYDEESNDYGDNDDELVDSFNEDLQNGRNETDDWEDEEEWEKEEEKEEEEWENQLEKWETENEGAKPVTKSDYETTTLSAEQIANIEKQEEEELEEWLENYEDVDNDNYDDDDDDDDDDAQPSVITEGIYEPETYSQNVQSDWSVNTPIIVVGSCAAVVMIALVFILVGKKLAGKTDRAKYKPLKESFSGSATYHEDI